MRFVVGITGGIASGKTAVTDFLQKLGYAVVDADVVSRRVTARGGVGSKRILKAFPECSINGEVDRRLLRKIVFSDEEKRQRLNGITHPLIVEETKNELDCYDGLVFLAVPLLFESGMEKLCDTVVTVSTDLSKRINRLVKRDNIDETLAYNMIQAQLSDEKREELSDYVVRNNGSLDELEFKIKNLCDVLTEIYNKKDENN